ncbi:MAG: hypothetical protein KAX40_03370 [Herpetosiphon sp.]|nr:hypothetical protein [Herpetosiphon sp.]
MRHISLFESALSSEYPSEKIRKVVQDLIQRNKSRDVIYEELECFRQYLLSKNRTRDENIVLDTMDYVAGWCSPSMKL